jgi:hypothetical protein
MRSVLTLCLMAQRCTRCFGLGVTGSTPIAFRLRHAKIGAYLEKLAKKNRHAVYQQCGKLARIAAARLIPSLSDGRDVLTEIEPNVPQSLPRDIRDAVIAAMVLAVLEARIKQAEIDDDRRAFP